MAAPVVALSIGGLSVPFALPSGRLMQHPVRSRLYDPARLAVLRETALLDAPPQAAFDRLTRLAARLAGVPTALLTLVDADRQVVVSACGLPPALAGLREVPRSHCLCVGVVDTGAPIALADARIAGDLPNDGAVREWGVVAYVGVPLETADGFVLGSLSVVSGEPRTWDPALVAALQDLARLGGAETGLRRQLVERARIEQASAQSERYFRALIEHAHDATGVLALDGTILYESPSIERVLGYRPEEMVGRSSAEFVHPADLPQVIQTLARLAPRCGSETAVTYRCRHADGSWRILEAVAWNLSDDAAVGGVVVNARDVTERAATGVALRESEELLRAAQEIASVGSWTWDARSGLSAWSDELQRIMGLVPGVESPSLARFLDFVHHQDRARVEAEIQSAIRTGSTYAHEYRVVRPDGEVRMHQCRGRVTLGEEGTVVRVTGTIQDITERVRAEAALRASEERFRALSASSPIGIFEADNGGQITYANPRMLEIWGMTEADLLGAGWTSRVHPEDVPTIVRDWHAALAAEAEYDADYRLLFPDGTMRYVRGRAAPLRDSTGAVVGAVGTIKDVTERRRAELALTESERRLRLALGAARMVAWELDLRSGTFSEDRDRDDGATVRLPGGSVQRFATLDDFRRAVHVDDRERIEAAIADALANRTEFRAEYRVVLANGEVRWRHATGRLLGDRDGTPERVVGVAVDVTERKTLEEQFRQAQKMEAVGQLAGGIAHDFNNLLMVIGAGTAFVRDALPAGGSAREDLEAVDAAATRAAELTRQLLAFSRKQILKPELVDLNQVVRRVEPMLRRLIGEDIAVVTISAPGLPPVLADPGQLEQVLMNLAVNARDAMPHGGRLVIETATIGVTEEEAAQHDDVAPGSYVRLCVRDTGIGMDEATSARVFEPFFTTKEVGRGTGLGLSTVYGIVKQSGGHVWMSSTLGQGTTFHIDLPAAVLPSDAAPPEHAPGVAGGGTETILLVEDEAGVRAVLRRILVRQGYTVIEAANGREALDLVASHAGDIDLVVTDVVMPEMSGRVFAEELEARHPGQRVVFMSGYTDDEILRRGLLTPGRMLLEKPFTAERLLEAVRVALRGAPDAG
jgi:two-component system cell cycle sensor histidine kinase/response regulator CckA